MKILVDSHVLVWLLYEPERFDVKARKALEDAEAVYVSTVSLWELSVLHGADKLRYAPEELVAGVETLGLAVLPMTPEHAIGAHAVKDTVRDVWDRMLLAQGKAEGCKLMTGNMSLVGSGYDTLSI